MTPIMQALAAGYGADELLDFVSKAIPKAASKIRKAQKAGYAAKDIAGYISNLMEAQEYPSHVSQNEIEAFNRKKQEKAVGQIAKLGASAVAGYAGARLLGSTGIGQNLLSSRGLPKGSKTSPSQSQGNSSTRAKNSAASGASGTQQTSQDQQFQQASAQSSTSQNPPESPLAYKPPIDKLKSQKIIKDLGLEEKLNEIVGAGNNLDYTAKILDAGLTPEQRKTLTAEKPLVSVIKDYLSTAEPVEQPSDESIANLKPTPTLPEEEIEPKQAKETLPFAKGSIVSTPEGIVGEVKSTRNGSALVDDNGKLHKVKESELERPDESVIETVQRLLDIPEIDRSSVISYWAYDPEEKQMFVQFHNGETYKYKDVDEETVDSIAEALGIPKTEGQNIFGAWSPEDKKSVGATMIQKIIADPKYRKPGKGQPDNQFYKKLRKGYDYWSALRTKPKR